MVPITLTENMHPVGSRLAPDSVTEPPLAVIVPPPQEPFRPVGLATMSPGGRMSVKPTPVTGAVFGLVIVNARVVAPLSGTVIEPNAFVIIGGPTTFREAVAEFPGP